MNYIFNSAFCVAPAGLRYAFLSLFTGVLSSDNSIVCFRSKAFLKSDTLAGFTTSVALIWYIECVISSKFNFYSNLFEFGALHFHWMLARWDATVPHIPERQPSAPLIQRGWVKSGRHIAGECIQLYN